VSEEANCSLIDAAARLGVHYMTAYRYVRTGRLEAHQEGSQWLVGESALRRFEESRNAGAGAPRDRSRATTDRAVERLVSRLVAGDEAGGWGIVQEALVGGFAPTKVYLDLFVPALRSVGQQWADGHLSVADEHRASVVMHRFVGRMGPLMRTRGPRTGKVVVGAPAGEMHDLPATFAADILRSEGFDVVDLGADVPPDAFSACALATDGLLAVAICVTTAASRSSAGRLIEALKLAGVTAPIIVGGAGLSEVQALQLGADQWTADVGALVRIVRAERRG
jgi:excisionase family DNA binding protein